MRRAIGSMAAIVTNSRQTAHATERDVCRSRHTGRVAFDPDRIPEMISSNTRVARRELRLTWQVFKSTERHIMNGLIKIGAVFIFLSGLNAANGQLRPWSADPWYWEFDGEPVLLLGGSDDDNLFQWPEQKLIEQLDRLQAAGGSVIRNTMSDRRDAGFEVYPFLRLENGKYDLSQWNPEYWQRFERLLRETAKREIVVQIEVWDRFDYTDNRKNDPRRWEDHPYAPKNNINYTAEQSGLAQRYPKHPGANVQPFFFTTPEQRDNTVVRQYQEAFVQRLLDHSLQFGHVLYCIDNETNGEAAWGEYWARLIRKRAEAEGKVVMVTEMWDAWDLTSDEHKRTFDHPELYDFVDVSQNNQNKGQKHWDNFLYVREYLSDQPRPMNTTKTYGADGNKFGHSDQDAIERFWRHLLAGAASIRFHRPDSGLGLNDKAVACIRAARIVEQHVPAWRLQPANDLLRDRQANEAYLAATEDRDTLVVYLPQAEEAKVSVDLRSSRGKLMIYWIHIDSGAAISQQPLEGGKVVAVRSPKGGNVAAVITRREE